MKKLLTIILLFLSNLSAQQFYLSALNGMEDNSDNTHLFYRKYYFQKGGGPVPDQYNNSIHHFDLEGASDTLFLYEGGGIGDFVTIILDLEFWNNNPSEFIYIGAACGVDCDIFIKRFDDEFPSLIELDFGSFNGIEISGQDDSLLFATANFNLKSTDGGRHWYAFDSTYKGIVSINPFNDDLFFADFSNLYKSANGGLSFSVVDTSMNIGSRFFYDSDSLHIYNLLKSKLRVSNNLGNAFSWTERYSGQNKIYVTVDYAQSGNIYLADGRRIYFSNNYGNNFSEYKVLNRNISGIYKKPGSDKLYAATKHDIFEITSDTIISLKHLKPHPDLSRWYPFKIGNKWIYEEQIEFDRRRFSVEIIDDTTINSKYYFKIKTFFSPSLSEISYERFDSTNGVIYRYFSEGEIPVYDFTATETGDTIIFNDEEEIGWTMVHEEPFNQWGLSSSARYFDMVWNTSVSQTYTFVKDIGLYRNFSSEITEITTLLRGFIKDGIVYGDTSLGIVSVDDEERLLKTFSLSQNYPNPFNPTTKIKYSIPSVIASGAKQSQIVTLKVYDILGREVATLVNEEKPAGVYEVEFDANNFSSGVYYYQLKSDDFIKTKKMVYLK